MPLRACYPLYRDQEFEPTYGQLIDLKKSLVLVKQKAKRKRVKDMSPNGSKGNPITRQVFDLSKFANVDLVKEFYLPAKPADIKEALALVDNKQEVLLDLIYKGLVQEKRDAEYNDINGFKVINEDGEPGDEYSGKFASSEKKLLINAAVLNIAKLQGYNKDMTPEQKEAAREKAMKFIRDNPAMIESIQG